MVRNKHGRYPEDYVFMALAVGFVVFMIYVMVLNN